MIVLNVPSSQGIPEKYMPTPYVTEFPFPIEISDNSLTHSEEQNIPCQHRDNNKTMCTEME